MIDFNTTIMAVSIAFTVFLALLTIIQIYMVYKGENPLEQPDKIKYVFVLVLIVLVILMVAHLLTSLGTDGVGKDNMKILLPGVFAIVFGVCSYAVMMYSKKIGETAIIIYSMCLVITWICVIVHVVSRVLL